jgi:GNAT superfamily N-acetyltransferase
MDRQQWPRLEADNAIELLLHLGTSPLAERHVSDKISWVITEIDSNDCNGVMGCRMSEAEADEIITEVLKCFRGVPFIWYVTEDSRPADLGSRLVAHGCIQFSSGNGMAADLFALNDTARAVPGLVIERVRDERQLAQWCDIYNYDRERREPLYASLGLDGDVPFRHYLALLEGQAVGTASLFLGKESAGLYNVEVIPAMQKRGIGTALTLVPFRDARAAGYRVSVLGPSPEGYNMYVRLGFVLHKGVDDWYTLPYAEAPG